MTLEKSLFSRAVPQDSNAPDDRATTFQAVEGGGEHRSGTTLLVEAYAVIWTILQVWLLLMWRKQGRLNDRLDGLEGAIARASSRSVSVKLEPGSHGSQEEGAAPKLGGQPS